MLMSPSESTALKKDIEDFQDCCRRISQLNEISKRVRARIAEAVNAHIDPVNEEEYREFLVGNTLVSVKKAKGCNDYTVLYKEIPSI